jgi:NifB/MoaA-like Fe-S oxidoreductase
MDGSPVNDMLDLASACTLLCETVYVRGCCRRTALLRRNPGDPGWGLHVQGERTRVCRNRCPFCFIDQNPEGVRPSLLLRDDDVRYSFLRGTYVTLDDDQLELALRRRLSPVNVSVHATDPHLRGRLLGREGPAPVVPRLRALAEAGLEARGQIVVVPGLNDGAALEQTVGRLLEERLVRQLGVVPVGLTDHRRGLPALRRPTADESAGIVSLCLSAREGARAAGLGGWIWPADELFVMAGIEVPGPDFYQGCGLMENGIGMLASLSEGRPPPRGEGVVLTGTLAHPFLSEVLVGTGYRVEAVENGFFGPMVGVAGLLSGADVVSAMTGLVAADEAGPFFLPSVMFNSDSLTLDDLTPADISRAADAEVSVADSLAGLP